MKALCICFGLESTPAGKTVSDSEKDYLEVYKPAAKFLYANPGFCMAFSFNGNELQFFKKKHPEFLAILQQLISRRQIEVFGGGFYNPVFPLLYPKDRTDQIELLSAEIRQTLGKRPRGMTLCASSWDASLVTSFQTCGMEYVVLDSSLIPPAKQSYLPVIMFDRGKSVTIVPVYRKHKPSLDVPAEEYLSSLFAAVKKSVRGDAYDAASSERFVDIQLTHAEFQKLLQSGYLQKLADSASAQFSGTLRFSYPGAYLKTAGARVPAFITAGIDAEIAQWAKVPYTAVSKSDGYPVTIYDFLQTYPESQALCNRMLYVSMLANQCHGDKARKKVAREKLWAAQSGEGFVSTASSPLVRAAYRRIAFRNLSEAEKIIRECSEFEEAASRFDYNADGIDEYMFRMTGFTACITRTAGAISELDVMQSAGNYADNLSRMEAFDGCTDDYVRSLFIDYILSDTDVKGYVQGKCENRETFLRAQYTEQKFSPQHKEVQLLFSGEFGEKKQALSVRKKYAANSNGFTLQYIVKNESAEALRADFVVESNFAQANYDPLDFTPYTIEIASGDTRFESDSARSSAALSPSGIISDVSAVQLSDAENSLSFMCEPNESCALSFMPITFRRPESAVGKIVPAAMTLCAAMHWPIDLAPGMETEKTINFSIIAMKRKRTKAEKRGK